MPYLLIVDDEEASSRTLKLYFERKGFDVGTAISADQGMAMITVRQPDVVISDIRMPGRDGLSLLAELHIRYHDIPVIMITAFHDMDSTVSAMRGGAIDYVPKPIDLDELEMAVERALAVQSDAGDYGAIELTDEEVSDDILGQSSAMKDLFKAIGLFSRSRVTVLIQGEVGTGKSLVARTIHKASGDTQSPFILVDCTSSNDDEIEEVLIESSLGSFSRRNDDPQNTDRDNDNNAGGDTVFLENIDALSLRMQGKLLHFLESGEVTGANDTPTPANFPRVIASSSRNIAQLINDGQFREDLFYMISPFSVEIPPLRERQEDIPELVENQLAIINKNLGEGIRRVSSEAMEIICAYAWPGNIGQMNNVLTKVAVITPGDTITGVHISDELNDPSQIEKIAEEGQLSDKSLKDLEREHIHRVLEGTGWHKGQACEILGISRPRLDRRIAEYGFTRES